MLREIAVCAGLVIGLSACAHAPSPQKTSPSHRAECAALREQMLEGPINGDNNTPYSVHAAQDADARQLYHDQCE